MEKSPEVDETNCRAMAAIVLLSTFLLADKLLIREVPDVPLSCNR